MSSPAKQRHLIGWRKGLITLRVATHVVLHFAGEVLRGRMGLATYPRFLYRALLFLGAVRHNKIVRRGGLYKLQLYVPAYPTRAFFHTLEKLYRAQPGPVSVVLSMTRACSYRCPHCYQQRDRGQDLDMGALLSAVEGMQDLGVTMFDIEGGEPLLRSERLIELLGAIDDRAESWINTTGAGLNDELLAKLRTAGLAGVMISLHAPDPATHDAFTGVPGSFAVACQSLAISAASAVL